MGSTYIKFYENEYRTIEIIVRDMEEDDFCPDTATFRVEIATPNFVGTSGVGTSAGTLIIVPETVAQVIGNRIRANIPVLVTQTKGVYHVLWNVHKDGRTYKHRTVLNVSELI
jgi:hypothetical protein